MLTRRALLASTAAIGLAGCSDARPWSEASGRVRLATGTRGAVFDQYGAALARVVGDLMPATSAGTVTTGGSVDNVLQIVAGRAEIGFCLGDTAAVAVAGSAPFEGATGLVALARLYDELPAGGRARGLPRPHARRPARAPGGGRRTSLGHPAHRVPHPRRGRGGPGRGRGLPRGARRRARRPGHAAGGRRVLRERLPDPPDRRLRRGYAGAGARPRCAGAVAGGRARGAVRRGAAARLAVPVAGGGADRQREDAPGGQPSTVRRPGRRGRVGHLRRAGADRAAGARRASADRGGRHLHRAAAAAPGRAGVLQEARPRGILTSARSPGPAAARRSEPPASRSRPAAIARPRPVPSTSACRGSRWKRRPSSSTSAVLRLGTVVAKEQQPVVGVGAQAETRPRHRVRT
ncbi:hypothetical protein G5V59_09235 [Nocardioides sp. W3-2-3]|nr:hypothetical protein [Nocardioides convexus]